MEIHQEFGPEQVKAELLSQAKEAVEVLNKALAADVVKMYENGDRISSLGILDNGTIISFQRPYEDD